MTLARRSMSTMIPPLAARLRARSWAVIAAALTWSALAFVPVARADELQDVSKLVANGKLDDAEKRADAYLKQTPKDAQMRFLKGVILSQRGKRDEAVAVFTGLTQDFPELPEPYNNLAVIFAAQGQYDKARDALETALRVSPNDATAYENLGDVYAALAARSYRDARRHDPNNAASLRKLDAVRALLTGPGAAGAPAPAAPAPAAATSSAPAAPDPRAQRNVGMARPAGPPATVIGFGAEPPEIVVPSVGTVVPQGSNVVAVGAPDSDNATSTATLAGATTVVPGAPINPIPAITAAVQRWAASRSVKTGELNIRVDGDSAIARFREEPAKNARKSVARTHALTLRRNGSDWAVTDDKVET
jgi:Flp pilus assembly protein TadD